MRLQRETFLALFPERRLFFVIICIGGIIGFYLLSIWPHQQAAQQFDIQIDTLNRQISEHKLLAPTYKRFTQLLGDTQPAELGELPFPSPDSLKSEQVAGIEPLFRQLAEQNQLKVRHIGADLNSMIGETRELKLALELSGNFNHLRGFMLKLGELPYLTHVERIEIRREAGMAGLHMEMEIWLARQ